GCHQLVNVHLLSFHDTVGIGVTCLAGCAPAIQTYPRACRGSPGVSPRLQPSCEGSRLWLTASGECSAGCTCLHLGTQTRWGPCCHHQMRPLSRRCSGATLRCGTPPAWTCGQQRCSESPCAGTLPSQQPYPLLL